MLLSDILEKSNLLSEEYEIINEKDFETLGLLVSKTGLKLCGFLESERHLIDMTANVTMVITTKELKNKVLEKGLGVCVVKEPRKNFFRLHNLLATDKRYCREYFKTIIGKRCCIAKEAIISENNVIIGDNVVVEEFVVIRENTVIGDNTIIRAGSKIGGEGFEFKRVEGIIEPVKHLGGVVIGSDVEIQYNSCIDKAVYPWDDTVIGDYTKIDDLVYVAHGVKIAERVMVVAQSGIGGRTVIGADTWIGIGATIRNGLSIGCEARTNMGSVVTKNVSDHESVTGNFAIEHKSFIENLKMFSKKNDIY